MALTKSSLYPSPCIGCVLDPMLKLSAVSQAIAVAPVRGAVCAGAWYTYILLPGLITNQLGLR
ncbi:hypothetical protein [Oscillatoria sp. HE19RPO]|uniref:hypothetical protein n=1 Tax=Oscillatoria sp. HE19RPO TaxID=2954806 RepID=UPI0020C3E2AB|nr:hypothetical protein [Oscillatoria sp. HE19RPO]